MSNETPETAPQPATPPAQPAETPVNRMKKKRRLYLALLALVVVLGVAAWLAHYMVVGRFYEETDDAYVNGNIVPITPRVAGTIISITADDGDYVEAGQILIQLDPSDASVTLQNAQATLAQTVRQVRGLYSNADNAQAQVRTSQVAYERARADYNRRQQLANSGAIASEELAHARDTLNSAQSALDAARHAQQTSWALVNDTELATHPEISAASAQVLQAYLDHSRTEVRAPVSGYVAKRSAQVGSHVSSGETLLTVVPLDQVWIDANFKENQMRDMRIGQPVDITTDLYGSKVHYRGTIESLGIGTGSAFSLLPAQNATGNWIKIVQRLPVRIRLQPDNLDTHPLRIGLSSTVTVDLRVQDGTLLPQQPVAQPRLSTQVFDHEMIEAHALIERIIRENSAQPESPAAPAP